MKRLGVIGVLLVLIAGCGRTVDVNQARSELIARDREWSQSTKDLDRFVSFFAADGSFLVSDMPIASGSEAIRKISEQILDTPGFSLQWTADEADVGSSGDLGYTLGHYTLTVNDPTGKPVTTKGKYVTVWKRQPDGWKVVADTFNADAPPRPSQLSTPPS